MAYVSSTSATFVGGAASVSLSVSSGDVLLAVFHSQLAWGSTTPSVPDEWTVIGSWSAAVGEYSDVVAVAWMRASTSGTTSASFGWGPFGPFGSNGVTVTRWSGMKAVAASAAQRVNGRTFSYPAAAAGAAPNGHAVRIASSNAPVAVAAADYVPAGHTLRASAVRDPGGTKASRIAISDQSLTSATPAAVSKNLGTAWAFGWGITVYLASHVGPDAPVIVSPAAVDSVMDLAAAWTLDWVPSGVQTAVRVTRQTINEAGNPVGTLEYLTSVSSPAWSTTPATVTTATSEVDFPAAQFSAAGTRYRITVATVGDVLTDLGSPASVTVTSWQAPVASNPSVGGSLVGGVIISRNPWVTVWGTPGSGASIDLHEVQVVDSTTGEVYAGGTYYPGWWYVVPATEEGAIPNGVTVTLRGRVRQRGVQWSPWVEAGPYPVSAPRPDAPTVTVGQTTHPTSGLPGLAVTVTSDPGNVTVYRDGVALGTWESATGTLTVGDYVPPTDVPVSYTATVSTIAALPETSLHSPPATATLATGSAEWLIDPLDPSAAVRVYLEEVDEITHDPRSTPYQPIGSSEWIVRSLGRVKMSGSMSVQTFTAAARDEALSLLTSGRVLMLRVRPDRPVLTSGEEGNGLPGAFRVTSGVGESRPARNYSWRRLSFEWVEQ